MRIEPEIAGCSIVMLGKFNPAIFQPAWFSLQGITSKRDVEEADVSVIHPEITIFKLGWILVKCEQNRFSVDSTYAPYITLADFVSKTFGEILTHTPVEAIGINRSVHFGVGSEEARTKIGRILAPTDPWGEWGKAIEKSPAKTRGGMQSLTMQETWEGEQYKGRFQVKVEPSVKVSGNSGIFVNSNDHFEPVNKSEEIGCEKIISFMLSHFEQSIAKSETIIDQIMSLKESLAK